MPTMTTEARSSRAASAPITVTALANVGTGGASHANALAAANSTRRTTSTSSVPVPSRWRGGHSHRRSCRERLGGRLHGCLGRGRRVHPRQRDGPGRRGWNQRRRHRLALQHIEGSNVAIFGNLRSLARATGSGSSDVAKAGVGVFADGNPGNIVLIETQAPIAQATAGDPVTAFRQANFSTEQTVPGPDNSYAFADIDIEPGESGAVIVVTPTTDQQLRLQTLADIQPEPAVGLELAVRSSLLSIDHHDCGVLGGAGQSERKAGGLREGTVQYLGDGHASIGRASIGR